MANENRNRENARNAGRGGSNREESGQNTGGMGTEESRRTPGSQESESENPRGTRGGERESDLGGSDVRNTSGRGSNPSSAEEENEDVEQPGEE